MHELLGGLLTTLTAQGCNNILKPATHESYYIAELSLLMPVTSANSSQCAGGFY